MDFLKAFWARLIAKTPKYYEWAFHTFGALATASLAALTLPIELPEDLKEMAQWMAGLATIIAVYCKAQVEKPKAQKE